MMIMIIIIIIFLGTCYITEVLVVLAGYYNSGGTGSNPSKFFPIHLLPTNSILRRI